MKVKTIYLGDLSCESTHQASGAKVRSDAPVDNHGKGQAFSPTDFFAVSLGQCILTTIAILGESRGIKLNGASCEVEKRMSPAPPRRISELVCELRLPGSFSQEQRRFIEKAANNCPVALSLHPDVRKSISFVYD